MKLKILAGSTSRILRLFIGNSSVSTGAGLTGLTSGSSGLIAYYCKEGDGSATAISLSGGTLGTFSSGGFVEMDATHLPGCYELGVPNAALTGAKTVLVMLSGATNMVPTICEIELDAVNYQDAVRFGLTALPNANANASGGLMTFGTGAGQINPNGSGAVPASTLNGTTPPTNWNSQSIDGSGRVLLQPTQTGVTIPTVTAVTNAVVLPTGTGAGQISLSSGAVALQANQAVNSSQIGGHAVSLDANNLLNVDVAYWDGTATTSTLPNTTTPPTTAAIAAAILASPTHLLATDASGGVTIGAYESGQDPFTLVMQAANGVETGVTLQQAQRLFQSVLSGKASVAGAVVQFKRLDGTTTALTVTNDPAGDRSASTIGTLT